MTQEVICLCMGVGGTEHDPRHRAVWHWAIIDFPRGDTCWPSIPTYQGADATAYGSEQCGPRQLRGQGDGNDKLASGGLVGKMGEVWHGCSLHTLLLCSSHPQKLPGVLSVNEMWSLLLGGGEGTGK